MGIGAQAVLDFSQHGGGDVDGAIFPIFLRPKYYFMKGHLSPIVDTDIGIAVCVLYNTYASFYFNPNIGLSFNRFNVSFGYKLWTAEYVNRERDPWNAGYLRNIARRANNALSLKINLDLNWGIW